MYRIILLSLAICFGAVRPADAAWEVVNSTLGYSIIGVHTEIENGVPVWEAYFFADKKVIALHDLQNPDIQLISKKLTDAYNTGKKVFYAFNQYRDSDVNMWYPFNTPTAVAQMTFYRVRTNDKFYMRIK